MSIVLVVIALILSKVLLDYNIFIFGYLEPFLYLLVRNFPLLDWTPLFVLNLMPLFIVILLNVIVLYICFSPYTVNNFMGIFTNPNEILPFHTLLVPKTNPKQHDYQSIYNNTLIMILH